MVSVAVHLSDCDMLMTSHSQVCFAPVNTSVHLQGHTTCAIHNDVHLRDELWLVSSLCGTSRPSHQSRKIATTNDELQKLLLWTESGLLMPTSYPRLLRKRALSSCVRVQLASRRVVQIIAVLPFFFFARDRSTRACSRVSQTCVRYTRFTNVPWCSWIWNAQHMTHNCAYTSLGGLHPSRWEFPFLQKSIHD